MMIHGLNVAAFKLPIGPIPAGMLGFSPNMVYECRMCEPLMITHNMQVGGSDWGAVALRAPFNQHTLNDPAVYRSLMTPGKTVEERLAYEQEWGWTEVAAYCPDTTQFLLSIQGLGQFMGLSKFMRVRGEGRLNFHADNVPGKEFRIAVGLEGVENEVFLIKAGRGVERLVMKPYDVWFIDVGMAHAVYNDSKEPRYRLGAQFYGPPTDQLVQHFMNADEIVYAEDYDYEPPFIGQQS